MATLYFRSFVDYSNLTIIVGACLDWLKAPFTQGVLC